MWGTGLLIFVSSRDGVLRDETNEGCEKDFNTRQKSWNNRVCFPFPSVDLGITVVSVLQNTCGVNIGEGAGHIWVRTEARRVDVRNFRQNSGQMVSVSTIFDEYCRSLQGGVHRPYDVTAAILASTVLKQWNGSHNGHILWKLNFSFFCIGADHKKWKRSIMAFQPQYMTSLRSWRDCYIPGTLLAVELWSSRGRLRRQKNIDTPPTKSASYTQPMIWLKVQNININTEIKNICKIQDKLNKISNKTTTKYITIIHRSGGG